MINLRNDIQFLRGLAVLSVLFFHARVDIFGNGYLGVDVFFVISGYLITGNLLRSLETGQFSFSGFYLRRARRLLPALYATLTITISLAYLLLTQQQWDEFLDQLWGSLTFTANIVLPQQVGYFDGAAETKPLLHIWSLSLEEQFYFLVPLLLLLTRATGVSTLFTLLILFFVSLSLYLMTLYTPWAGQEWHDTRLEDWAFYLLPTRAWELLAGSLLAAAHARGRSLALPPLVSTGMLIGLIALLCWPERTTLWRGIDLTLPAVALTALLIATPPQRLMNLPLAWPMQKLGDWSYSVYLIHWPLMSLSYIAWLEQPPAYVGWLLIALSIVIGALMYSKVEQPWRLRGPAPNPTRSAAPLLVASVAVAVLTLPYLLSQTTDPSAFKQINRGIAGICARGNKDLWDSDCRTSPDARMAVWGDSHAMHLVPGLVANPEVSGLVQLTNPSCNPVVSLTTVHRTLDFAEGCMAHNQRALEYILADSAITDVIISSPFGLFYPSKTKYLYQGQIIASQPELAARAMAMGINSLKAAGKNVLIVSPPPSSGRNIGDCLERELAGLITLGQASCDFPRATAELRLAPVKQRLEWVAETARVSLLWLPDLMCSDTTCRTRLDGVPLFRDGSHLSIIGSQKLFGGLDPRSMARNWHAE